MASENQGGSPSPASPRRISAAEKQRQALELRKAGVDLCTIAAKLGYAGPSGARAAILSGIKKIVAEPANEVKELELTRLDRLMQAVWTRAIAPVADLEAIDRVLKIISFRAKLLGLEVPQRLELKFVSADDLIIILKGILMAVRENVTDPEIRKRIQERYNQLMLPYKALTNDSAKSVGESGGTDVEFADTSG